MVFWVNLSFNQDRMTDCNFFKKIIWLSKENLNAQKKSAPPPSIFDVVRLHCDK